MMDRRRWLDVYTISSPCEPNSSGELITTIRLIYQSSLSYLSKNIQLASALYSRNILEDVMLDNVLLKCIDG